MKNLAILTILLSIAFSTNAQPYNITYNKNVATVDFNGREKKITFYSYDNKEIISKEIGECNIINLIDADSLLLSKTSRRHFSDKSFPKSDIIETQLWANRNGDRYCLEKSERIIGTSYPIFSSTLMLLCLLIFVWRSYRNYLRRKDYRKFKKLGDKNIRQMKSALGKYKYSLRLTLTFSFAILAFAILAGELITTTYESKMSVLRAVVFVIYPFVNLVIHVLVSAKESKLIILE